MNIFTISRPRFWLYLLGPYMIGLLAAFPMQLTPYTQVILILLFCYFLLPGNLMLYGINDIFDYETDKLNSKKERYESVLSPHSYWKLLTWIAVLNLPFLVVLLWTGPWVVGLFIVFWFLSIFYSAKPIRAKTKPFVDSLFNVLYILPGLIGYTLAGGATFAWPLLIAAALWVIAMHAYSAVPDIKSDTEAQIYTIATFLGKNTTLVMCSLFYLISSVIAAQYLGIIMYALGLVYLLIMYKTFLAPTSKEIFKLYTLFPKLNTLSGFIIVCILLYLQFRAGSLF